MAGFVAFATQAKDGYWIRTFRNEGLMTEYLFFYCYTIVCLLATYFAAILCMIHFGFLAPCLAFSIVNVCQVVLVMYGAHKIADKAAKPLNAS